MDFDFDFDFGPDWEDPASFRQPTIPSNDDDSSHLFPDNTMDSSTTDVFNTGELLESYDIFNTSELFEIYDIGTINPEASGHLESSMLIPQQTSTILGNGKLTPMDGNVWPTTEETRFDNGQQGFSTIAPTSNIQNEAMHPTGELRSKKRGRPITHSEDSKVNAKRTRARESQRRTRRNQKERMAAGLPAKTRGPDAGKLRQPSRPTAGTAIPVAPVNRSFVDLTIDEPEEHLHPEAPAALGKTQQAPTSSAIDAPQAGFQFDPLAFDMHGYHFDETINKFLFDLGYQD